LKNKRVVLILVFFHVLVGYTEGNEEVLPPIDEETLIAGLKHAESSIPSGRGRLHFHERGGNGLEFDAVFAFDSYRAYYHYLSGMLEGKKLLLNRRLQLCLDVTVRENKIVGLAVSHTDSLLVPPDLDVRNWGMWILGTPMSQYLKEHKMRIVGCESLKIERGKLPCYIVETESYLGTHRLWIAPGKGFRPVKEEIRLKKPKNERWEKRFIYTEFKLGKRTGWFLRKGIWDIVYPGRKVALREIEVKDFQPNADISDLFQLDLDPETPVWDESLSKVRPFKEIGWEP